MANELTPKQEAFALKYLETGNASEAYRQSYDAEKMKPESVHRKAFEVLENVKVAARINELKALQLKRHNVTVDRVLAEYAKLAFLDIRKAFDEAGNLKPIHMMDNDTAAAIVGLDVVDNAGGMEISGDGIRHIPSVTKKIKLSDKKGALDSLGKYLGMFIDRSDVRIRKPITEMTDEELNAELAEYERTAGKIPPGTSS